MGPILAIACGDVYSEEMPAFAHCSSWSPVTPLTPTAPMILPPLTIGTVLQNRADAYVQDCKMK